MVRTLHLQLHCGRAVIWQSRVCSCWVFKCLLCGDVSHADCGLEAEDHWDYFEYECEAMS